MDDKIKTYNTLWNLVDLDPIEHKIKDFAKLLLQSANDWPTLNQTAIIDFVKEFKTYFGEPITLNKIKTKKFDGNNTWQLEAASSIREMLTLSHRIDEELDFDRIINNILNYYNVEFNKVDFIAELKYLTDEQGGRSTPVRSGYRPQVKFDFEEMQTSGQQTFIDKEIVHPGDNVKAKIKILSPDYFANTLIEGMDFEFREGARIIGTGKIEYIVNDKLGKPAGNNR